MSNEVGTQLYDRALEAAERAYKNGRVGTKDAYNRAYRAAYDVLVSAHSKDTWGPDRIASYIEATS